MSCLLRCNRNAGSRTPSLLRYVFLSGLFLMSRYVATLFFQGTVITTHSRTRTTGIPANRIQSVVSIIAPIFSFSLSSRSHLNLFNRLARARSWLDYRPIRYVHVLQRTPTRSLTPSTPVNGHSNTGAIVGGVVGGVAAIAIIAAVIFFYLRRRRSRARSAVTPGVGASQAHMDETKQPLTEEGTTSGSPPPGTSMPGTPGAPMRFYVRVFMPDFPPRSCVFITCAFLLFFIDAQDPNDPTTFPGPLQSPLAPQGTVPSHSGTGTSLPTMQTSRPQGYHGLPVV